MEKILVVDDEMMNRVVASKILKKEGYAVVETEDGAKALEILQKQRDFALVLMDLMMPVMDGFVAIERMKEDEELRAIPVIVISALSDKESIYKALEMGANDYLGKPFDLVEFRLRIQNSIKLRDAMLLEEAKKAEADALSLLAKAGEFKRVVIVKKTAIGVVVVGIAFRMIFVMEIAEIEFYTQIVMNILSTHADMFVDVEVVILLIKRVVVL